MFQWTQRWDPADPEKARQLLFPEGKPLGAAGSRPGLRIVRGSIEEAYKLFRRLSVGGKDVTPKGHPGRVVRFKDGRQIGYRPVSKSEPAALDLRRYGLRGVERIIFLE